MIPQESTQRFKNHFPRIFEAIIPLTCTGVTPRNFFSWRSAGLIELSQEKGDEERQRVKLNLVEFTWVKMIDTMRAFGISYKIILKVKALLFANYYEIHSSDDGLAAMKQTYMAVLGKSDEESAEIIRFFKSQYKQMLKKYEKGEINGYEVTTIFQLIVGTMYHNTNTSLLVIQNGEEFDINISVGSQFEEIQKMAQSSLIKPHFTIPLLGLIESFFDEPESEKYWEFYGFIGYNEMKVLEAMRKQNYKEIRIINGKGKTKTIQVVEEGNFTDEQVGMIRRILGMKDYDEIELKYRNNKNLYFKKISEV
jgi:hypothetical protein